MHALRAQELLAEKFGVAADVWSATSYKELRRDALEAERWNMLHPAEKPRQSYVEGLLAKEKGVFLAVSDYMRIVAGDDQPLGPRRPVSAGHRRLRPQRDATALRRHFEVDAECITVAALSQLARRGEIKPQVVADAIKAFGINPEKISPLRA